MRLPQPLTSSSVFGDAVILLFLLAQAADGVLTYAGVRAMGLHVEGNPLLVVVMGALGLGAGLAAAKLVAAGLGISLHIVGVHRPLAILTMIYLLGAVMPWAGLLLGL